MDSENFKFFYISKKYQNSYATLFSFSNQNGLFYISKKYQNSYATLFSFSNQNGQNVSRYIF